MLDHDGEPSLYKSGEQINDENNPMFVMSGNISGRDGFPSGAFYLSNFITQVEEQELLKEIGKTSKWTNLNHRRLLSLPSALTGSARDTLIAQPLPEYLIQPVLPRLQISGVFLESGSPHHAPNHVLVNEYQPGQGIMPHEDGPAYFPITATVSLGSHTVLNIYKKTLDGEREPKPAWRILQEPRSLLVTKQPMYTDTLHGIAEVTIDEDLGPGAIVNWHLLGDMKPYESGRCTRQTRISLTYRDVLKVAKLGGAMKFLNKK